MRSSLWLTIIGAAAIAASIGPPDAHAADVQTSVGIPQVQISATGASLARRVAVAVDNDLFGVDASTSTCAQPSSIGSIAVNNTASLCEAGGASNRLGEHSAGVTLKLPRWDRAMPYVDLSVRTSPNDAPGADSRGATPALTAEVEVTRAIGRYEFNAGYSHPLAAGDGWRVAWAGAAIHIAGDALLHLSYESARDTLTGAHDARYALRLTRTVGDSLRAAAYVTHAPDDIERRWQAGVGLDWTF